MNKNKSKAENHVTTTQMENLMRAIKHIILVRKTVPKVYVNPTLGMLLTTQNSFVSNCQT